MGLKAGIIGLPNVGKSTIFNALTESDIAAENYPFCTIDPNIGIVKVPDIRLNNIAEIIKPEDPKLKLIIQAKGKANKDPIVPGAMGL